jgi:hypothetical protein
LSWFKKLLGRKVVDPSTSNPTPTVERLDGRRSGEITKTVPEYVEYLDNLYGSWKSKKDILGDVQLIDDLGASLRRTRGAQFCREIIEALSLRSSESAQALGEAWNVDWVDSSTKPTKPKLNVGDHVYCSATIDPGYGQIVKLKFENGAWHYWVQREDKPANWAPAKTAEHWLSKA